MRLYEKYKDKLLATTMPSERYYPPTIVESLTIQMDSKFATDNNKKEAYTEEELCQMFEPVCTYCNGAKVKNWYNVKANKFLAQICGICDGKGWVREIRK